MLESTVDPFLLYIIPFPFSGCCLWAPAEPAQAREKRREFGKILDSLHSMPTVLGRGPNDPFEGSTLVGLQASGNWGLDFTSLGRGGCTSIWLFMITPQPFPLGFTLSGITHHRYDLLKTAQLGPPSVGLGLALRKLSIMIHPELPQPYESWGWLASASEPLSGCQIVVLVALKPKRWCLLWLVYGISPKAHVLGSRPPA
jgi:hypothetical protein